MRINTINNNEIKNELGGYMWNKKLIKKILNKYRLPNYRDDVTFCNIHGYPHIVEIKLITDSYYLKEVIVDKTRKVCIEKIYEKLDNFNSYIHPLKNIYGNYLTSINYIKNLDRNFFNEDESYYLLTKKMEQVYDLPSAQWWADCLSFIHKKKVLSNNKRRTISQIKKGNLRKCIVLPNYLDTLNRLNQIHEILDQDIRNLIKSLLTFNKDFYINNREAVTVHGDPNCSNIAVYNGITILYDFESSGISVPEYDIQRLFTDIATNSNSFQEIDKFIVNYIEAYENKGMEININILDYLFKLDLIRTICWLYEVSVLYKKGYKRQYIELEKYKKALRKGYYHRVISAIHKNWHYDITNININNKKEIMYVAKKISRIIPNFIGVTLGGSRSYFLDDELSDVELYFYSEVDIPSIKDINRVLGDIGALHKRTPDFLWNEEPWGAHSFFEFKGLYFEIGYRILSKTKKKIKDYLSGKIVDQKKDCHDLGMGYLFSSFTASVQAEKIIFCNGNELLKLKELTKLFPNELKKAIKEEYMNTAESMINGKLYIAAQRQDVFFYNVLSTRVIRCLMIMAFSITNTHFPGDKWNESLLLRTGWKESKRIIQLLNFHMSANITFIEKYSLLLEVYNIIKVSLEEKL